MITFIVFGGLALALFALSFVSKRRFGLLGLALTAGATLSVLWGDTASIIISATGLVPIGPTTTALALSLVVLFPAVVLLFHGYTYKDVISRVIGSLFFTVLALAFLLEPVAHALPLEGVSASLYAQAISYKDIVLSVGVVLAIFDLFFTKPKHLSDKDHKKK